MHKIIYVVFLSITFIYLMGYADEKAKMAGHKYELSVCALLKDDADFVEEWIEYHKLLGVEHFYLYDLGKCKSGKGVLTPYLVDGTVTLIPWHNPIEEGTGFPDYAWHLTTEIPAYENAVKYRTMGETKWLAILGVDEFLVSPKEIGLKKILEDCKTLPGIFLTSEFFKAPALDQVPCNQLVIEGETRVAEPKLSRFAKVKKAIVQPEKCEGFEWPNYHPKFKGNKEAKQLSKQTLRVHSYINRFKGTLHHDRERETVVAVEQDEVDELLNDGYQIQETVPALKTLAHKVHDRIDRAKTVRSLDEK